MSSKFPIWVLFSALLSLTGIVEAKTLYVNGATGSDTTTYAANTASTPWRTIGRAAWGSVNRAAPNGGQAAQAGDTVIVRAGTYSTVGTGIRYDPAYNPANSGTASQPIVFQGEGTVTLTLTSGQGPVIGSNARNYITWKGFTINEANARSTPDTGMVVLWSSIGSGIEDSVLIGNGDPGVGDNHPGIRIEGSSQLVVRNNRISNLRTSVVNPVNGAGIQIYYSGGVLIENNDISDCGSGIFLKAPMERTGLYTIRNNLVSNVWMGIIVHRSPNTQADPVRIYRNIVNGAHAGIAIWPFDSSATDPRNAKVVNNTIHNANTALFINGNLVPNSQHLFWNNIVTNSADYALNFGGAISNLTRDKLDLQHNLYHGFGRFALVESTNYALITLFKTVFGQDSVSPASINVDPLYTNAGQGNFHLQANSPARSLGVDILDLNGNGSTTDVVPAGAYVTGNEVIGLNVGGQGSVRPVAPPDFRVEP